MQNAFTLFLKDVQKKRNSPSPKTICRYVTREGNRLQQSSTQSQSAHLPPPSPSPPRPTMSHMTDSSPWLKRYVQNALSTTPRPQTLHGFYLQVISSVSPRRHLRVYDGHHTAEAVLSPSAASYLDADPDDLGVTTFNLTGHLIAPVAAVVVPDASTTPPTATLVLNDLRVFSDQCAQRPPGVLPPVDRDPDVLNCLRANVGRKLATFATRSTFAKEAAASDRNGTDIHDLTEIFDDIVDNPALPPPDLLNGLREFRMLPNMDLPRGEKALVERTGDQLPAGAEEREKPVVVVDLSQSPAKTPPRQGKDGAMSDDDESEQEMPELQMLDVPGIGDGDGIEDEGEDEDDDAEQPQQTDNQEGEAQESIPNPNLLDQGEERAANNGDVGNTDAESRARDAGDDPDREISFGSQDQTQDDAGDDDDVAGEALPQTQHFTIDDDDDEDEDEDEDEDGDEDEDEPEEDGEQTANGTVKQKPPARDDANAKEADENTADDVAEASDEDRDATVGGASTAPSIRKLKGRERSQRRQKDRLGKRAPGDKGRDARNNNGEITSENKRANLDPEVPPAAAPADPRVTAGDSSVAGTNNKRAELRDRGMDTKAGSKVGMGGLVAKPDEDGKRATVDTDAPAPRVAGVENGKQKDVEDGGKARKQDTEDTGDSAVKPSSESEPSRAADEGSKANAGDKEDADAMKDTRGEKAVDAEMKDVAQPAESEEPSKKEKSMANGKTVEREKPAEKDKPKKAEAEGKVTGADSDVRKSGTDAAGKATDVVVAEPLDSTAPDADDPMDVELPTSVEVKDGAAAVEVADVTGAEGTEATQPPETEKAASDKGKAAKPDETATEDVDVIEPDTPSPETDKDENEAKTASKAKAPVEAGGEIALAEKKGAKRKAADFLRNEENYRKQMRSKSPDPVGKEAALKKLRDEIELLRNFRRKVNENPTGFVLNPDAFLPPLPGSSSAKKKANAGAKQSFPPPDLSKYRKETETEPETEPESEAMPQVPDSAPI